MHMLNNTKRRIFLGIVIEKEVLLVLCGESNVGALVLLCPQEANSKNHLFELVEI
jgi:hypothetical protein